MSLSWEKVKKFLDDPGERWVAAYEKLSPSEKILLLSLLDTGGREKVERVRQIYDERIKHVDHPPLRWSQCLTRLMHSFLKASESYFGEQYIDYQHPSLRDMLLTHLTEEPVARRAYIASAGPEALANIIQGTLGLSRDPAGGKRFLLVESAEEQQLVLHRLRAICSQTLMAEEWHAILAGTALIVRRPEETGSKDKLGKASAMPFPSDSDLDGFAKTWEGKVVSTVVISFSSRETFERNQRYGLHQWMRLIMAYYRLAPFVVPLRYLEFTHDIVKQFSTTSPGEAISHANVISRFEPLLIRQIISNDELKSWHDYIQTEVAELVKTGEYLNQVETEVFSEDSYLESREAAQLWDEWQKDVAFFLELTDFYQWAIFTKPEEIGALEDLYETVEVLPPDTDEPEMDRDDRAPAEYWTVDEMFADL